MTGPILVILRHAKAERGDGTGDVDRSLTGRGHADAAAAGSWLVARGYTPDLVLCSPAKRTRQTWHAVAVALGDVAAPVVRYEPVLYESGATALLRLVRQIGPEFGCALLVGHNPTVSQLSALLDPDAGRDSDGLRTSGLAVHGWTGTWSDCRAGQAPRVAGHTARG